MTCVNCEKRKTNMMDLSVFRFVRIVKDQWRNWHEQLINNLEIFSSVVLTIVFVGFVFKISVVLEHPLCHYKSSKWTEVGKVFPWFLSAILIIFLSSSFNFSLHIFFSFCVCRRHIFFGIHMPHVHIFHSTCLPKTI